MDTHLSPRARARACLGALLLHGLLLASWPFGPARADSVAEYRIKAGFLYNFMAFTEWPADIGQTLAVCVYGPDPFGDHLDTLRGKGLGGRVLAVKRANNLEALEDCQAVFIARSAIGNLPRVLDRLGTRPVLTIADSPGAGRLGVALNMTTDQGRVGFEANLAAARGNGLNLSSKLLRLAGEVRR
jgi:hypothetical protein